MALLAIVATVLQLNAADRGLNPVYQAMELAAPGPLLSPQDDGTICLNADAAAIIQWPGKNPYDGSPQLVNGNKGVLKVEDGHITIWNGFKERPFWRISVPKDARYRVTITRSAGVGRESTAWISIWKKDGSGEQSRLMRHIEPTGRWDVWSPFEMGEANLKAGEYLVEYTPREWVSATFLINLVDIRLIPIDELRAAEAAFRQAIARSGITDVSAVKAAGNAMVENSALLNRYQETLEKNEFVAFKDYQAFLAFDEASEAIGKVKARQSALEFAHREAVIAESRRLAEAGKLAPADDTAVKKYLALADEMAQAASRDYPKAYFKPPASSAMAPAGPATDMAPPASAGNEPIFPTGDLAALPKLGHAPDEKATELVAVPAPDMAARRRVFNERNTDPKIAELCRRFSRTLVPGTPGLEIFEKLVKEEQYREALAAYRTYFFEKLGNPEKFGGCDENFVYTAVRGNGKKHLLKSPDPVAVEFNRAGASWIKAGGQVYIIRHGQPGQAVWAPLDLKIPAEAMEGRSVNMEHPWWHWQNQESKPTRAQIDAWSSLRYLAGNSGQWQNWTGFFPSLLFDYTVNGAKSSLELWSAYMDDYCMNGRADQNRCLVDIRQVTELETQMLRGHLNLLRIMFDERPAFAEEMDPASLARMMMMLVTDYAPYTIRMRRAEQANWGIMGLCHLHNVAALLPEFKAMQYFNREMWRAQMANTIQHRTLDGENLEAWDLGHNYVDTGFQLYSIPFARPIPDSDELFLASFWDNVKVMQRNWVTHLSPAGFYWPTWSPGVDLTMNNFKTHMHTPAHLGRYHQDLVVKEPWVARRVELATQAAARPVSDSATRPDEPLSDLAPYAAMAYLREAWANDADYLIFMNWRERSQEPESASRTGYLISRGERMLMEAPALAVDRKPEQYMYDAPRTGGKTQFCTQAGDRVEAMRFHTSTRFDYVDGWQDVQYAIPNVTVRHDYYGLYPRNSGPRDPKPVTSVRALRQVHYLRGQGLYIIADRIEAPAGETHEYSQFYALPGRLPQPGFNDRVTLLAAQGNPLVEENRADGLFRTRNPGFDNVVVRTMASAPLTYANRLNAKRQHATDKTTLIEEIAALVQRRVPYSSIMKVFSRDGDQFARLRPVSASWQGSGNQSLVSVVNVLPGKGDPSAQKAVHPNDLADFTRTTGKGGVIGFTARTAKGAGIAFQSGPNAANPLACGIVTASADSLLVLDEGGQISGLALGCTTLAVNEKSVALTGTADFEFEVRDAKFAIRKTIRSPIDTVRIQPEQSVFTEKVQVSFDIRTQKTDDIEYRYTLDGSDPTLESAVYKGPFTLRETTRVLVRPFRKGLMETPGNFTGCDSGRTMQAIFRKEAMRPAARIPAIPDGGLQYAYFEGDWPTLFSYAGFDGVLQPKAQGHVKALLHPEETAALRQTDGAYAIRYEGYLRVPQDGVYSFHAPEHLFTTTMDAGYDLRVFIDGEEWFPGADTHATGFWSIPLAAGPHRFEVAYVDYRVRPFRNENNLQMIWKSEQMWPGTPVLEVTGPHTKKQPIPVEWLCR